MFLNNCPCITPALPQLPLSLKAPKKHSYTLLVHSTIRGLPDFTLHHPVFVPDLLLKMEGSQPKVKFISLEEPGLLVPCCQSLQWHHRYLLLGYSLRAFVSTWKARDTGLCISDIPLHNTCSSSQENWGMRQQIV